MSATLTAAPADPDEPQLPRMAGSIVVTQSRALVDSPGHTFTLTIDGEPFPWLVAYSGVDTSIEPGGTPAITLTIPARSVSTSNTIGDGDA